MGLLSWVLVLGCDVFSPFWFSNYSAEGESWLLYFNCAVAVCVLHLCDFQQCGILSSVDLYEPVQPPFKLRNAKCCLVSSLSVIEYSSDLQRL